jgi:hypothetical protein
MSMFQVCVMLDSTAEKEHGKRTLSTTQQEMSVRGGTTALGELLGQYHALQATMPTSLA